MQTTLSFLKLHLIPGIGPATVGHLLEAFGSAEAIFEAGASELSQQLKPKLVQAILDPIWQTRAQAQWDQAHAAGVQILTRTDGAYPQALLHLADPPTCLYVKGDLCQADAAGIAIVGTRRASLAAKRFTQTLAEDLSRAGLTIVSGLAEGIDGAAHKGALEAGRTLAVLGHGLDFLYPPQHEQLATTIVSSGALLSEFPFGVAPDRKTFPKRNRLIAALSLGTIVVEAPYKSGALITAREALELGREVFAVPGAPGMLQTQGPHALLRDGAALVESAEDVLETLRLPLQAHLKTQLIEKKMISGSSRSLDTIEAQVYGGIPEKGSILMDQLVESTTLPTGELMNVLTELELKGMILQDTIEGVFRR